MLFGLGTGGKRREGGCFQCCLVWGRVVIVEAHVECACRMHVGHRHVPFCWAGNHCCIVLADAHDVLWPTDRKHQLNRRRATSNALAAVSAGLIEYRWQNRPRSTERACGEMGGQFLVL